jgi:hypothetical protein
MDSGSSEKLCSWDAAVRGLLLEFFRNLRQLLKAFICVGEEKLFWVREYASPLLFVFDLHIQST